MSITNLIETLVTEQRSRADKVRHRRAQIGALEFTYAYLVASLNAGRGAGHTQAIRDLASDRDLAVFSTQYLTDDTMRKSAALCLSVSALEHHLLVGRPTVGFERVWVDYGGMDAARASHTVRILHKAGLYNGTTQFIFLGGTV